MELVLDVILYYQLLGPTTARETPLGMIADSFVDPFAHVLLGERQELFGVSGNQIDYVAVKGTSTAVDFRADNATNFDSLEKNSIDLYASFKSLYLTK